MIYVDLYEAFDSTNRDVLCKILALREIPPKLVNLISGLYFGLESELMCDGTIFDYFLVNTGVRQSCVRSRVLFNILA